MDPYHWWYQNYTKSKYRTESGPIFLSSNAIKIILCKLTYVLRSSKQGFVYTFMLFHSDLINVAIEILKRLFHFHHNI